MKPEYVAKKSAWCAVTPLRVLLFWLIIPLIVMIVDIMVKKKEVIEFYEDKIVQKKGILNIQTRTSAFVGVLSVDISQTLLGRILGYGNISVDAVGIWDVETTGVVDPNGLKAYLETRIADKTTAAFARNPVSHDTF